MNKKIEQIFADVLSINEDEVLDSLSYISNDKWDSIKHMKIVARLEKVFSIEFSMQEIIDMDSVQKIKEIIDLKLKN